MNRNEYFDNPAVSRGLLQKFIGSSRTGYATMDKKYDSSAMSFGRAFHYYMESEQAFDENVYVLPNDTSICEDIGGKKPRSTKLYKEWKQEHIDLSINKELITEEEYTDISNMVTNIQSNELYLNLVKLEGKHDYERVFYTHLEGLDMKALADYTIETDNKVIVIDWKTTISDLSRENAAQYEVRKWKLNFQHYHYSEVIKAATGKEVQFIFFFSEKKGGNEVLPVIISPDSELITDAASMWFNSIANYKDYSEGIITGIDTELDNGVLILE